MMAKRNYLVLIGICLVHFLQGQSFTLTGIVIDEVTRGPIPSATVFINNSTMKSVTDAGGSYFLDQVPLGNYDLVVHYSGFYIYSMELNVANNHTLDTIVLQSMRTGFDNTVLSAARTASWENHYKEFNKAFIGNDEFSSQVEILNPFVLSFSKESGILRAYARESLEISNMYLGYKVSYYLKRFELSRDTVLIDGYRRYDEITAKGGSAALVWTQNRRKEFSGSSQHFLKALIEGKMSAEEFSVYRYQAGVTKAKGRIFYDRIGIDLFPLDSVKIQPIAGEEGRWAIEFQERVEVHHKGTAVKDAEYRDIPYAVSRIDPCRVNVNSNGTHFGEAEFPVTGNMDRRGIVRALPFDFDVKDLVTVEKKKSSIRADMVEENIYVSFDKPYYYKGEMIWMKAFVNYRFPQLRDSMSKTLYIDLINNAGTIVRSQLLRIDSGFAKGNFVVSDTLTPGLYHLRAHTNLNRNFEPQKVFVKPIPILGITQRVKNEEAEYKSENISLLIKPMKSIYEPREKIELQVIVSDQKGAPVASNLSISVTDARQVVPIRDYTRIDKQFPFHNEPSARIFRELKHPVEYGITFNGRFVNDKGKPEKATINVLQGDFENLTVLETENEGSFQLSSLVFYDSTEFRFQARDAKNRPVGSVEQLPASTLQISELPKFDIAIEDTDSPQRLISEYEVPWGARMLEEVLIKGRREQQEMRPYGKPDYVVKIDELDISTNNLMQILQGKIPGLTVQIVSGPSGDRKIVRIVRASGLTILGSTEPLVMIDNVPMSGAAGDILESINAYTVESIEVITRVNPAFGSQGVNGAIMIYTKTGFNPDYVPPIKPMQVIKLGGYTRPDTFRFPIYDGSNTDTSQADYRSIIYWNPDFSTTETGRANTSFYAADLRTTYRIVVEGITENNEPVRGVSYISVKNND